MKLEDSESLVDSFLHWAREQPDAVLFTQPVERGKAVDYTWRQVEDEARRMAAFLRTLGFPPRSQIAILGKNSAHWIVADLAIWMAGHVSVPLYPTLSVATARYVLEHSEARLVFVGKMEELWAGVAPAIPANMPVVTLPLAPDVGAAHGREGPLAAMNRSFEWNEIVATTAPLEDVARPGSGDLATIVYTSGSTGEPKGVMISFGAMLATARGLAQMFPLGPADRMLSYLPLAHAAERALVETTALYFGFRVFFAWSLDSFLEDLRRARPTLFFSVPRLWTRFYQGICAKLPPSRQKLLFRLPIVGSRVKRRILEQLGLEHVRAAITGSAPLAPALIAWYREVGLELLEGYALSENFAYSHGNRPGDVGVGTVGRVGPGVECRISEEGEVQVKSPGNMLGYFKNPQKTAEDLPADGFLRTGDMGEIDAHGRLRITGRIKDLFKTAKGKYVAPVPIENRLCAHPLIESACVAGTGHPQPFALLMLAEGAAHETAAPLLETLLSEVNAQLEPHEQLDFLAVVRERWTTDNGLLTPTLKMRRGPIEKRYSAQFESWARQKRPVVLAS